MNAQHLIAWSLESVTTGAGPLKVLAVVGGAALGGFGLGALTQLLVKLLTAQQVPPWPLRGVRLGGALLCGWLVALWAFGGGGGGLGGSGGWGFGNKDGGKGETAAKITEAMPKEKKKELEKEVPANTVRIEVLGDHVLKKIVGPDPDLEQRYRLRPGKSNLLSLPKVEERLRALSKDGTIKYVEIVLYYRDSPARRDTQWVLPLEKAARSLLGEDNVTIKETQRPAPIN